MTRTMIYTLLMTTTLMCTAPAGGWAMLAPAHGQTDSQGYDRQGDLRTVRAALETKAVRARLKALGLSDKEVESRMSKLSDQQVHQMAKDIKTLSPGGDVGGALVLVILVLLILYLVDRL